MMNGKNATLHQQALHLHTPILLWHNKMLKIYSLFLFYWNKSLECNSVLEHSCTSAPLTVHITPLPKICAEQRRYKIYMRWNGSAFCLPKNGAEFQMKFA